MLHWLWEGCSKQPFRCNPTLAFLKQAQALLGT